MSELRCLIADDHQGMRRGLSALLEAQEDMTVIAQAAEGREALALIFELRPDVSVLDARMPHGSGLEVCRALQDCGLETGVVFYTGDDDLGLLEAALATGVRGYVRKAGPFDALVDAVRTVGAGGTHIDPQLAAELRRRPAPAR